MTKEIHFIRNGVTQTSRTLFEPDAAFAYNRNQVRYCRSAGETGDLWTVRSSSSTGNWTVLPKAAAEIVEQSPDRVVFRLLSALDAPLHLAVLRGNERVGFLFLDPPQYAPVPADAMDAATLGITPDSGKLCSDQINAALATLSANGGGTLYFGPGSYEIATLMMRDNTYLHLDSGAVLTATEDLDCYPMDPVATECVDLPRSLRPSNRRRLILFDHVRNAGIVGKGEIDGRGSALRLAHPSSRAALNHIRMVNCENILIQGIILSDSEFWNSHILLSDRVTYSGVKIVNEIPPLAWDSYFRPGSQSRWNNADGINPDSSSDIVVEHCFLHTGDDCVPIKNTASYKGCLRDVRNIKVRSCMMLTSVTAMKVGTETLGEAMQNIEFEDIDVVSAGRVFAIDLKDGAVGSQIVFRNIRVHECNRPLDFWILTREDQRDQTRFSNLSGVLLESVDITRTGIEGSGEESHIMGLNTNHTVSDVCIRNLRIAGQAVRTANDFKLALNPYAMNIRFEFTD
ncbi:MAG: glycosyl hydrolase family 28 protein [Verrucomicrobia bacterium]|nr:glycosyl hydrolase family 28 protein [Verrucomicrobiota bacterium]